MKTFYAGTVFRGKDKNKSSQVLVTYPLDILASFPLLLDISLSLLRSHLHGQRNKSLCPLLAASDSRLKETITTKSHSSQSKTDYF